MFVFNLYRFVSDDVSDDSRDVEGLANAVKRDPAKYKKDFESEIEKLTASDAVEDKASLDFWQTLLEFCKHDEASTNE